MRQSEENTSDYLHLHNFIVGYLCIYITNGGFGRQFFLQSWRNRNSCPEWESNPQPKIFQLFYNEN